MKQITVDIAIIGGGVAGLWTLARLRNAGYSVILLENKAIGGVQSIASQGIIHGGTKYALGGRLGDSAKAIGDMPGIWQQCLNGEGELDLSAVRVLTQTQLLWSGESALSRVAGFFAGKMMQDRMQSLQSRDFPPPFDHPDFKGAVYQLNEPVIDAASLMQELYKKLQPFCYQAAIEPGSTGRQLIVRDSSGEQITINTGLTVLSAGRGNASLLKLFGQKSPKMQKRPVHMVMVKGDLPEVYAHCLGASANPRVTITSGKVDGEAVWYIGGGISETGVNRSRDQQIAECKKELKALLPWLEQKDWQWSTIVLDRSEIQTAGNKRPESSFVKLQNDLITVWPTKLAFAPRAAAQVLEIVRSRLAEPQQGHSDVGGVMLHPPLAQLPWIDTDWVS